MADLLGMTGIPACLPCVIRHNENHCGKLRKVSLRGFCPTKRYSLLHDHASVYGVNDETPRSLKGSRPTNVGNGATRMGKYPSTKEARISNNKGMTNSGNVGGDKPYEIEGNRAIWRGCQRFWVFAEVPQTGVK